MFGFSKKKKAQNALDEFIFAVYGNPPPAKRRPRTGDYLGERTPHGRCASAGSLHSCSRSRGRVDSVFHTRPSAFGRSKLLQAARVYSATFHGPTFSPDESTLMVQRGLGCWPARQELRGVSIHTLQAKLLTQHASDR